MRRKHLITLGLLFSFGLAAPAQSNDLRFFKIASGAVGGTYYPIAGMIGQVISNPPGSKDCRAGGNCGVPDLTATAQTSGGSVANVELLRSKQVPSAIAQSDVTYWAHGAHGPFRTRPAIDTICAISALYPEEVHLVRAASAKIENVPGLAGMRVALGKRDSGALLGAQLLVRAYGLAETKDFTPVFADFENANKMMKAKKIDAFVTVSGYPNRAIADMAERVGARLVPVDGAGRDKLVAGAAFYRPSRIPAGTYPGQRNDVETVAVPALWLSRTDIDQDLLYKIVNAFWTNPKARGILDQGHPKGKAIMLTSALAGVSVPLCPGAEKFYREIGHIK